MNGWTVPVQMLIALLLVTSGLLSLIAAYGIVRSKDFFQRLHSSALCSTLATGCAALASALFFSLLARSAVLHALLIPIFLVITVPVTTTLLGRAVLFRQREAGLDVPEPLARRVGANADPTSQESYR